MVLEKSCAKMPFMKLLMTLFGTLILSSMLQGSPTQCIGMYTNDEAPDILDTKLLPKTQELCYSAFALMHSGISRTPLWSAEHLTRDSLRKKTKRSNDFYEEEQIESNERARLSDYSHSGYDRGHMAPSADMPTKLAQHECFTLANMVPQNSDNNRGIWAAIENSTRTLAKEKGELYVITGPLFTDSIPKRLKNRVLIPNKIYKAIYDPSTQKGAAYLVDNTSGNQYETISIMELEKLSGIRFFPSMKPIDKQNAMRLPNPFNTTGATYHDNKTIDLPYLLRALFKNLM
jgi:endonuclease G